MLGWLDSDGVRVAAYLLAAAVALVTWSREQRRASSTPTLWPAFWLLSAVVFLGLAVARAADLGSLITQLGRNEAFSQGWYSHRRRFQALTIAAIGATWVIVVAASLWRVPARRRRYLPAALAQFTLMCFIGIRMISLHQVDSLLYRREVAGARVGTLLELVLLAIAVAATAWPPPIGMEPLPPPVRGTVMS
jgi:hypothetical protein